MKGPIIIGGIGGSGTRAIASILQSFNIFIGDDLNISLDNLTYTLLFRRPGWYEKNSTDKALIHTGLAVMEKHLHTGMPFSPREKRFILMASLWIASHKVANKYDRKMAWIFKRLKDLLKTGNRELSGFEGWGWKEPNSHILVDHLAEYYPDLKYIHTIRHGLDMAYSGNQAQLFNWGWLYGISKPVSEDQIPPASMQYWAAVNRNMLTKSLAIGPGKILVLNFDNLCLNPEIELSKLLEFLELQITDEQFEKAVKIPVIPESMGRFRKMESFNLSDFRKDDLDFLGSLGYSCD